MRQRFRLCPAERDRQPLSPLLPWICLLLATATAAGCATLARRVAAPVEAETGAADLLRQLTEHNKGLTTFKGIGRMKWNYQGSSQHARIAWLGETPKKLRLEILDLTGRPALSVACDGDRLYFFSHPDKRFETTSADDADADLEALISIAIPIRDIIQLLTGRAPLPENPMDAAITPDSTDDPALILDSGWFNGHRRLYLRPDRLSLAACDVFTPLGALAYRVDFEGCLTVREFSVPRRITISGGNGAVFTLHMERYWANISVPPDAFTLDPPE
ncbi:MAG: hypothetical protein ACOZF0_00310 [Thermodesulfobacteriota bacterium]